MSGALAASTILAAITGTLGSFVAGPNAVADTKPQNMMNRWAPDERWAKWQEDVDRGLNAYKRKDYALAKKIYLKAYEKAKKLGDNPSKVVEVLAKLIVSMIDQGQVELAEPYYKEVLSLASNLNKKNALDEVGAICMEDLSNTYDESSGLTKTTGIPNTHKGRARAKFFLQHAIDIRKNVFTKKHPKLIVSHSQMANICIAERDFNGARIELEKIRDAMKGMNRKGWVHAGRFIVYLGCVYEKLARKADAERTFAVLKECYADKSGEIEKYRGNFYRMIAETNIAESWYRKQLAIAVKQESKYNEIVSNRNIGNCYEDRGNYSEAENYYRRGLELAKKNLRRDPHYKFTEMINDVERCLRAQKKYKQADRFHNTEAEFLRLRNPLFKSSTQLYQEEIEIFKEIDSVSRTK
ncbi:MAG: tetratricopeptide repeat protein [Candidatus Melainabacteria bacterium]|nr:tetratricopeptide repeat protein [Candidatus Melainabacteria bacterium]